MTAISRISKIRHPGTLHNFDWPKDLVKFGRYNLIYGLNGSGKTTISKLFRVLETGKNPANCEAVFSINENEKDIHGIDFGQETFPVRVFNRDFVSDNVFPSKREDMSPILVLGKDSIQKQREVQVLKSNLQTVQIALQTAQSRESNAKNNLDKHCINHASTIKEMLRSSGVNFYNNYNKSNFRERTEKMIRDKDAASHRVNRKDHSTLMQKQRAMPKRKIPDITYRLPDVTKYVMEVFSLLKKTVISVSIQSLKENARLSSWIHQGLDLHKSQHTDQCLFCEQTLPGDRLAKLEAHFNTEYMQLLEALDSQTGKLQSELNSINAIRLPDSAQFYEHLSINYEDARKELDKMLGIVSDFLNLLMRELTVKKERIFECYTLDIHIPEVDLDVLERIKRVVKQHNTECNDFNSQVIQAKEKLETDFIASNLIDFVLLKDTIEVSQKHVDQISGRIKQFQNRIVQLESEIIEHRKPAEELNVDIRKYLGHGELQLTVKDTGYETTRNNTSAEGLSEGETTAIALLYFLKSLQDRRFDLNKGVVVLDDPVSSLDANALYLAFGFIRERVRNAEQLFILTHNFTFFRQIKDWFYHINKRHRKKGISQRPARFYMLDWEFNGNQRSSTLRPLDPLLAQYGSEYHYLFSCIYQKAQSTSATKLKENYVLPNMARRLLEGFLAFRQPQMPGDLRQKLENVQLEESKKIRILRFLHTYSHSDSIRESEHDPSLLAETHSVLQDLLDLMEREDVKHYEAMVKLTVETRENGG